MSRVDDILAKYGAKRSGDMGNLGAASAASSRSDEILQKYGAKRSGDIAYITSDEDEPSLLERFGNALSGAAKSTASGYASALGTTQAVTGGVARKNYLTTDMEQWQKELEAYRYKAKNADDAEEQKYFLLEAGKTANKIEAAKQNLLETETAGQSMQQTAKKLSTSAQQDIQEAKQGLGKVGSFLVDTGVAGAQMLGDVAVGALTGGSALPSMFVRSAGSSAQEAREAGGTLSQQVAYGLGSGALSVATEKLLNVSAPFKKAFGEGVLDSAITQATGKLGTSTLGKVALSAISEGGEEFAEALVQPLLQMATYDKNAIYDEEWLSNALHDAAIGAALGSIGGGVETVTSRKQTSAKPQNPAMPGAGTQTADAAANAVQGKSGGILEQEIDRLSGKSNVASTQKVVDDVLTREIDRIYGNKNAAPEAGTVKNNPGETVKILQRLKESIPDVQTMKPVSAASVKTVETIPGRTMGEKAKALFERIKGVVTREGFGDVEINTRSVKDDLSHGVGAAKAAVIPAIPDVIRSGKQIDFQENWKGRPYDGYVFAAPVAMDGETVYVAAIVKRTSKNRLYLHEVVDSNGNIIKINNGDLANPTSLATDGDAGTKAPLSPSNMPQSSGAVKDPLLADILKHGKRVKQEKLSAASFGALAQRQDIGMDARENVFRVQPEHHIDRRSQEGVGAKGMNAFSFDHPELHSYMVSAANALIADAELSQTFPLQRRYERTMQGNRVKQAAQTSEHLRRAMEETGLSRSEIVDAAQRIVQDHGQENVRAAKAVELILDEMLTHGYQPMMGEAVGPSSDYIAAKAHIPGSAPETETLGYIPEELDAVEDTRPMGNTIGSAQAGFAGRYTQLQNERSEFHDEGENAARPVDVPTTDFDGRNISKAASTAMGAQAIPDEAIPMIEEMVAAGELSYDARTDEDALEAARATVADKGFEGALEQFRASVRDGKAGKDLAVLGQVLLNNAANARDGKAAAEILTLYQTLNTNVGQSLQAMRIFRKLSPESQLYGVQRSVAGMKEAMEKELGRGGDIEIDPELVAKFLEQEDQEGRDAVMREIYQNVADQVPATWMDKWNAWRYLAMLGNPRTHVRNTLGNVFFQPVRMVKDQIGAGLEAAFSAAGKNVERTKSFGLSPALYRASWKDYDNVKSLLGGSKTQEVRSEAERRRRIFRTGALEKARTANSAALEWEDAVFKRVTYADALAGYLRANGVTAAQLEGGKVDGKLMSRARDYAAKEALKATYQDSNALSRKVTEIGKVTGAVGDAILPFKRTPANVLARGLEYSPLGLAKALTADMVKVKQGKMSAAQALDSAAAGLTGTGLFTLGMYLFAEGLVTGGQGDGEEDKWAELLGHQGYAWESPGGTSVTLDWLAPAALPFFMGVELMSAAGESGFQTEDIAQAALAMSEPLLEMSMLQSLNDLIDSVRYAEGSRQIPAMVGSALVSYLSQAIPTIGGQIERSGENVRMTTYTETDNALIPTDLQYALGKASARIPGVEYQQIPYIDAWGREEESGDPMMRAIHNLANPAYVSQVEVDGVEQELQRLYDATGSTSVFPDRAEKSVTIGGETKALTAEQYEHYATALGQERYKLAKEATSSSAYKAMSDADRAACIAKLYSVARAKTMKEIFPDYAPSAELTGYLEAESNGLSPVEFYTFKAGISGAKSDEESSRKEKVMANINAMDIPRKEKDFLFYLKYPKGDAAQAPWN